MQHGLFHKWMLPDPPCTALRLIIYLESSASKRKNPIPTWEIWLQNYPPNLVFSFPWLSTIKGYFSLYTNTSPFTKLDSPVYHIVLHLLSQTVDAPGRRNPHCHVCVSSRNHTARTQQGSVQVWGVKDDCGLCGGSPKGTQLTPQLLEYFTLHVSEMTVKESGLLQQSPHVAIFNPATQLIL